MNGFLRVVLALVVRPLVRETLRATLTILGIAVGVGVLVAIQLSNDSAIRSFEGSVDAVAGRANWQIVAEAAPLDERLLLELQPLWASGGRFAPVIDLEGTLEPSGIPIRVLGVDLLSDLHFRDYRYARIARAESAAESSAGVSDSAASFFGLFEPDSVIVPQSFATEHALAIGSPLELEILGRRSRLVVRGILEPSGPATAFNGSIAIVDIATAQRAFDMRGRITRVDLLLPEGDTAALETIRAALPSQARIERPSRRNERVDKMLRAFRVNLFALAAVALLVGIFLVYNTVLISILRRRRDIGILRTLGVTRAQLLGAFLAEGLGCGLIGSALGLGLRVAKARTRLCRLFHVRGPGDAAPSGRRNLGRRIPRRASRHRGDLTCLPCGASWDLRRPASIDAAVVRRVGRSCRRIPPGIAASRFDRDRGPLHRDRHDGRGRRNGRQLSRDGRRVGCADREIGFDLDVGSTIELPTADGMHAFPITGIYRDYSNDRGVVVMDRALWLEKFRDRSINTIAIFLRDGADPEAARLEIERRLGSRFRVFTVTNAAIRTEVMRIFDQTFLVTWALLGVALVVAVLGIVNTLSALIIERRAEIALVRVIGVSRWQITSMLTLESAIVGLASSALGLASGWLLSLILIFVINRQSFGWTIEFAPPFGVVAVSIAITFLATMLAGLAPSGLASRIGLSQALKSE